MSKYGYGSTPIITIFAGNNHPWTIYFKVPRAPGFWLISIFWSSADQWFSMMWASVHSRKAQWFLRGFAGCRAFLDVGWLRQQRRYYPCTTCVEMRQSRRSSQKLSPDFSGVFHIRKAHRNKHHKLPPSELLQALPFFLHPSSSLTLSCWICFFLTNGKSKAWGI